jgi:multiple sugar transport system permease protein
MTTTLAKPSPTGVAPVPRNGSAGSSPRRRNSVISRQKRAGWWMIAPALVQSVVFITVPAIAAVLLAFTDYSFSGAPNFIGGANFIELFGDVRFRAALLNTVLYVLVVVPVSMVIALAVAVALNQKIRALGAFRTAYYIPVVTATVAVGTVWLWIFNSGSGLANGVLALFGLSPVGWLTDPNHALTSLMVVGIWQGLGAKMIIYLAALQGVSPQLVEAANLDGANRWQVFRFVTWPSLGPAQFFVLITSIVGTFQVFDLVYVMTKGGPGLSTNVLVFDVYNNAFQSLRLGYASAETVIMMILIGAFIIIGRRLQGANTHD